MSKTKSLLALIVIWLVTNIVFLVAPAGAAVFLWMAIEVFLLGSAPVSLLCILGAVIIVLIDIYFVRWLVDLETSDSQKKKAKGRKEP